MELTSRIFVAGHRGLVGSAVCRRLKAEGYSRLLTVSREELDLCDQSRVQQWFANNRPDFVIMAAAKVGGILANTQFPAEFLYSNLTIETNVVDAAYRFGVKKLGFLGSSCIYPKFAPQPISESSLLTGPLEPTNQWYAVAKIAGILLMQAYRQQYGFPTISLMPTNLYGPGDNFDLHSSHVLPALMRKFHEAKSTAAAEVVVWGTGTPRREFMHVDDMARATVFLMQHYDGAEIVNVGTGEDVSIAEVANLLKETTLFQGRIVFDESKPDGTPRKLLDVSKLNALGFQPRISLTEGLRDTYSWYLNRADSAQTLHAPNYHAAVRIGPESYQLVH